MDTSSVIWCVQDVQCAAKITLDLHVLHRTRVLSLLDCSWG